MVGFLIVFGLMAVSLGFILGYPYWLGWKRNRIRSKPFPERWLATVQSILPMYEKLTVEQQQHLRGSMQVLLAEKQFIGCNGLTVTEEMKVVIVAIASLLLFRDHQNYFPKLRSILIYPTAFRVKQVVDVGGGVIQERQEVRLGESWARDQLVLSWQQVQYDSQHWADGHNVVLHEFAHQLDQADGKAEGLPILRKQEDYVTWAQVMTREYQQLCQDAKRGQKTVLNTYGALNPAEFFAVATETFFEKPHQMLKKHPQLYQQLATYYNL